MPDPTREVPESPAAAPEGEDALRRGYARGRARDEQIRAGLEPLAPGERPAAVTVAIAVALTLGLANVILWLAGVRIAKDTDTRGLYVLVFAAVTILLSAGMWRSRYGAVLAFEALLAATIVIAALSLLVASNLAAIALCLGIVCLGGWLFWKLVRAMARIQASTHGPHQPTDH